MIDNPFSLGPVDEKHFVGRSDLITEWEERLNPEGDRLDKSVKNWLIYADGGMGKTSILLKLQHLAQEKCNAHTIFIDFGNYRDIDNPKEFFENFEDQIRKAGDLGTRFRNWVDLDPDASGWEVLQNSAANLQKLAGLGISIPTSLGIGLSIRPSIFEISAKKPESVAIRMSHIEAGLRATVKRRGMIAIFIDQLGKAHDSPLWCIIARLLLSSILNIRKDGLSDRIIFVVTIRPERYGQLIYQIQQDQLFSDFLFERKYLNPFTEEEAREALEKRVKNLMPHNLITNIVSEVSTNAKLDPYTLIQAANGVWSYLYEGDKQRSPALLSKDEIHKAITDFYINLTRYYQQSALQWGILKQLALYPGGLASDEIVDQFEGAKMRGQTKMVITSKEAEDILSQLINQKSFQIVAKRFNRIGTPYYLIVHDFLRDAILQQMPEEQLELEQATKLLVYAVDRHHQNKDLFTTKELEVVWKNKDQLHLLDSDFAAIAYTLLYSWNESYKYWLDLPAEGLVKAIKNISLSTSEKIVLVRAYLILALISGEKYFLFKAMKEIGFEKLSKDDKFSLNGIKGITNAYEKKQVSSFLVDSVKISENPYLLLKLADGLASLYEIDLVMSILENLRKNNTEIYVRTEMVQCLARLGEPALPMLADLAQNDAEFIVRYFATLGLKNVGISAMEVLVNLAQYHADLNIRYYAVWVLRSLGEPAQYKLTELATISSNENVRAMAVSGLADVAESPQVFLADLARNDSSMKVRLRAAEGLMKLGDKNAAREVIIDLAQRNKDENLCQQVAKDLVELGEKEMAKNLLINLTLSKRGSDIRQKAAEELAKLGEIPLALRVLKNLAQHSKDINIRQKAAEELAKLGEVDLAKRVLSKVALNKNNSNYLRKNAIEGLAKLGEKAIDILTTLATESDDNDLCMKAVEGLTNLGHPAKDVLIEVFYKKGYIEIRKNTAVGLAKIGERALARQLLLEMVYSSDPIYVRTSGAEGLAILGEKNLVYAIALNDPLGEMASWFFFDFS